LHISGNMTEKNIEALAEYGERILRVHAQYNLKQAESNAKMGVRHATESHLGDSQRYIQKLREFNVPIMEYENRIKKINDILAE